MFQNGIVFTVTRREYTFVSLSDCNVLDIETTVCILTLTQLHPKF